MTAISRAISQDYKVHDCTTKDSADDATAGPIAYHKVDFGIFTAKPLCPKLEVFCHSLTHRLCLNLEVFCYYQ